MNAETVKKVVSWSLTLVELGGIAGITGIALKRNKECYEAQCEQVKTEVELIKEQMRNELNKIKIKQLQKELDELKSKQKFKFMKKES